MSKWKITGARMSWVLDLCFQLFSNLFPSIIFTCIVVTSRSTSMDEDCHPWRDTKTQETFSAWDAFAMTHGHCQQTGLWLILMKNLCQSPRREVSGCRAPPQRTARNSNRTIFSLRTDCLTLLNPEIPVYGHPRVHQACKKYKMKYFKLTKQT